MQERSSERGECDTRGSRAGRVLGIGASSGDAGARRKVRGGGRCAAEGARARVRVRVRARTAHEMPMPMAHDSSSQKSAVVVTSTDSRRVVLSSPATVHTISAGRIEKVLV